MARRATPSKRAPAPAGAAPAVTPSAHLQQLIAALRPASAPATRRRIAAAYSASAPAKPAPAAGEFMVIHPPTQHDGYYQTIERTLERVPAKPRAQPAPRVKGARS